jgi:alanine racemase
MSWRPVVAPESIADRLHAAGLPSLARGVWLEIDLDALSNNVAVVREMVGPRVEVNAVVKADAYGHGLKSVGLAFEAAGVDRLCVASLDEALALREAGVRVPILVLFSIPVDGVEDAAENGIEIAAADVPTVHATLSRWQRAPRGRELVMQLEVETGLTRAGVKAEDVPALLGSMAVTPGVRVAGMWTHVATPESEEQTVAQVTEFERATARADKAGLVVPPRHMAATGGLLTGRVPIYEGVRIGLGLYGMLPLDLLMPPAQKAFADRLRLAMVLKALPLRVERFPAGVSVSYGGRWTTQRESVIATLPVGYADAIPRPAPWGQALVKGQRVPLVGTVAMDAVMADVTDVADGVGLEEEFVLLGAQGSDEISALELARARNTIPWEVATGMSYRIPRVYHADSVLRGLRTLNAETRVSTAGPTTVGDRHP